MSNSSLSLPSTRAGGAAKAARRRGGKFAALADTWLPRLVLSPTVVLSLVFVYGFIGVTAYLSLTNSRLMPNYEFAGFHQYEVLFGLDRWWTAAANLGIFCTNAAVRNTPINLLDEALGTAVLVVVAFAIGSRGVAPNGVPAGMGQWLVASMVWGIGLSLGGTTGYAINPARDLGPRLVHWLAPIPGKGVSNWSYAYVPIVGPLLGGALAGLLVRYAHL